MTLSAISQAFHSANVLLRKRSTPQVFSCDHSVDFYVRAFNALAKPSVLRF